MVCGDTHIARLCMYRIKHTVKDKHNKIQNHKNDEDI